MIRSGAPVVGITADCSRLSQSNDATLFLPDRYLAAIEHAGAIPIILPPHRSESTVRRLLTLVHGLVLSGGDFDIDPRYYGERAIKQLGEIKAARTEFELEITAAALKRDLPVLGICGGAQTINVALGGSLYQDIGTQLPEAGPHERGSKIHAGHPVHVQPGTRLFSIVERSRLTVNTSHHQAVKRLGRGLVVNAVADDGVIEGIESTRHPFVLGVQWHPEFLAPRQSRQRRIFSSFVAFCRRRLRAR